MFQPYMHNILNIQRSDKNTSFFCPDETAEVINYQIQRSPMKERRKKKRCDISSSPRHSRLPTQR